MARRMGVALWAASRRHWDENGSLVALGQRGQTRSACARVLIRGGRKRHVGAATYLTLDPSRGQIGPLGLGEFGAVDTACKKIAIIGSEGVPRRPPK